MFVRTLSLAAVAAGLLVVPAACGSFDASADPDADGGGASVDGGATEGAPISDGSVPDAARPAEGSAPGQVKVLASGYSQLRGIVATETDVYFIDQTTGGVHRVAIDGTSMPVDLVMGRGPSSLALADGQLFWTNLPTMSVESVAITGGAVVTSPPSAADHLASMIAASGALVFALVPGENDGGANGEIRQYASATLSPISGTISPLVNPFALAASGTSIYWTEGGPSSAVASAIAGSSMRKLLFTEDDAELIAADGAGIYWTVPSMGLVRASIGGAPAITIASGEDHPAGLASDGTYVYWQTSNNQLRRTGHIAGGTSSSFAEGFVALTEMHTSSIAVTSTYVVWLTGDGQVLRKLR